MHIWVHDYTQDEVRRNIFEVSKAIDGLTVPKILKIWHDINYQSPKNFLMILVNEYDRLESSNELVRKYLKAVLISKIYNSI